MTVSSFFLFPIFVTENHASLVKNSPSSFEHENPIMSSKPQSKLHAQKRGGNKIRSDKTIYLGASI